MLEKWPAEVQLHELKKFQKLAGIFVQRLLGLKDLLEQLYHIWPKVANQTINKMAIISQTIKFQ